MPRKKGRTEIIEEAVGAIAENVIKHPSTPYTSEQANTLKNVLEALEISKRIDRDDKEEKSHESP